MQNLTSKLEKQLIENVLGKDYNSTLYEADLILDKSSLILHIKNELMSYIEGESDINKLAELLKYAVKKSVTARGSKYMVSADKVVENMIEKMHYVRR